MPRQIPHGGKLAAACRARLWCRRAAAATSTFCRGCQSAAGCSRLPALLVTVASRLAAAACVEVPNSCPASAGAAQMLPRSRSSFAGRSCRRRRSAAAVDAAAGQPSPVWIHGGPARMSGNKTPDAPAGRRAAPVSKGAICTFCPSGFGRVSGCVKCSLAVPAPACRIGHALPPRSLAAACLACAAGCRHTPAPPQRPARLRSRATPLHTAAHCAGP